MYKKTIHAQNIIDAQDERGLWGTFHGLSEAKQIQHTEQALRRLEVLGFTKEDACIEKTVSFMNACLEGREIMPDRVEKSHNWHLFTQLMLATWIRRFTPNNIHALAVADEWAEIIEAAFCTGQYNHPTYVQAFEDTFSEKIRGDRFIDFVSFYQVSLLVDRLRPETEQAFLRYILGKEKGIYYIGYQKRILDLPDSFDTKQASKFLANVEMLMAYKSAISELLYVKDWLLENQGSDGLWDMGGQVKDYIYMPLSDSWRQAEVRKHDTTYRIKSLLQQFEARSNQGIDEQDFSL